MAATLTLLLCVRRGDPSAVVSRLLGALAELRPDGDPEVLVVGHGDPRLLAPGLREIAGAHPAWRVQLQSRGSSAREALAAATDSVRTPWVYVLGSEDGDAPGRLLARAALGAAGNHKPRPWRHWQRWRQATAAWLCTMASTLASQVRRSPP